MLLVVMLLGMATALLVYGMVDTNSLAVRRDRDTATAFAEVKRALIGWSVQRTSGALPNARPGELPCPDINPLDGFEDGNCAAGALGRVPWKTLGIPEPKDGAGETLWYAIAGPFRIWGVNSNPINSDTKGNLTVNNGEFDVINGIYNVTSTITIEAVAVLFAPGASLGTQNRDTAASALCPTTGTTIARNLCAANYLETAAGVNNSTTNGPFISAPTSYTPPPGFNDKVMVITTADLMPIVEQRVAREVRTILQNYKTATAALGYNGGAGIYPWADCSNGTSDYPSAPPGPPYPDGSNRGRFPSFNAYPVNWGVSGTPTIPNWFSNQGATNFNWGWVIYYSVGRNHLEGGGAPCGTCETVGSGSPPSDGSLSVNGAFGKEVVIIMTGPAGASRPLDGLGSGICGTAQWSAYLEDGANNDLLDDRYVTPSSTAFARDRIYTIP